MITEVYFDNSATTKPRKEVVDAMLIPLTELYGNPSSLHSKGVEVERLVKQARENVARLFNSKPEDIVFTSGGTEANNVAIRGAALANKNRGNHIVTTKFEHSSVLNTFMALEKEGLFKVTYLDITNDGFFRLDQLENVISDNTILVSIMQVNSEVGTVQPILEASKIIREKAKNAKIHVDAVQAYAKMETDPNRLDVDLMTSSSHKIHGPKGVGAIYIKKGTKLTSLIFGGSQENNIRPGTENIPGIVGFGKASEIEYDSAKEENERIRKLRENLEKKILENIPDTVLNGNKEKRAPHILNISFLGVRGEVLLHSLESKKIYVSTGSACSSHKHELSHVLEAMSISKEGLEGAIRFSLSAFNTQEEVDYCVDNLIPIVQQLRKYKRR